MLRLNLQQKLLQKLSPQQIQFIKLLQVPTVSLDTRIKEELEDNPALEDLSLAFNDLPLVFYLQALFSLAVGDKKLGVRISDAVLPALAAIPIYNILKNSKQVWLPAAAILVVLLHPVQLYFFSGDFIKNAAAIPVAFFIG